MELKTQLTSAQDAIKQAILEGRYGPPYWRMRFERNPQTEWTGGEYEEIFGTDARNSFLIDPFFWEALARSFKWDQPIWDCHKYYPKAKCENREFCEYGGWKDWKNVARQWFEARMFGNEKAFWQSLP